ncbi:ComF family protein [Streptomyces sp. AHA2]|uniref:ComF family protein n=1 Tax=Streptomyces sp. AHA2 TaxID=3064526 RepID=UPI002FE3CA85
MTTRDWLRELGDLVLPGECGGCGAPRGVLCGVCRAALGGTGACRVRPDPEPPGLPEVHAAARYADEVRAALLAHKERGALALAGPLGAALAGAVRAGLRSARDSAGPAAHLSGVDRRVDSRAPVLLVPVPSGRRAVRARGHDPARRIALAAAGELRRCRVAARVLAVLRQRRTVADQSGLNSRQRMENLAGALAVVRGAAGLLAGGPVVLVDDLMTTGASLAEAARAVRAVSSGSAAGPIPNATGTWSVYGGETWEGREEQNVGSRGERTGRRSGRQENASVNGVCRGVDVVCAAVVAAPPDSFEINRN